MTTTEQQVWHSERWHRLDREEQPLQRRIVENEAEHVELTAKLREITREKAEADGEKPYQPEAMES